eukprot:m51a1_g9933 hypothetical protein (219) ;mRNA; r:59383-60852
MEGAPTAESIARRLGFGDSEVEAVDWDVLLVHTRPSLRGHRRALHSGAALDALALHADDFAERAAAGSWLEAACAWLPRPLVLRQLPLPPPPPGIGALARSVADEAERDWRTAAKFWAKGDRARAARTVGHCARMASLASRAADEGCVSDWTSGNEHARAAALAVASAASWDDAVAAARPAVDGLLAGLRAAADAADGSARARAARQGSAGKRVLERI